MIVGILSDTHKDKDNALPRVIEEFINRGVKFIIHCGDIEPQHCNPEIFANLPVICALNAEQLDKPKFKTPPNGWIYTTPNKRILDFNHLRMYVGHKRSYDFLKTTEHNLMAFLDKMRMDNDGLRWVFSGHTHHQFFVQTRLVNAINPGAIEDSFDGYSFAVIDTDNSEIVFSRIKKTKPIIETFSVGIISDSGRVSKMNPLFWKSLIEELKKRDVKTVIHCGNIDLNDIGITELKEFKIYCNLRKDQIAPKQIPENWVIFRDYENPVIDINGYKFYIQLDLGIDLLDRSEFDMHSASLQLRRKYPEIDFILCGFTHNALLVEGEQIKIINPGDVIDDNNFAVICLPRCEITFGHVPIKTQ